MSQRIGFAFLFLAILSLILSTSPAKAASAWADWIQNNPCSGGLYFNQGPDPSRTTCWGIEGAWFAQSVPTPMMRTTPNYPLVGMPVVFEVGIFPNSLAVESSDSRTVTFSRAERFEGYRIETNFRPHEYGTFGTNMDFYGERQFNVSPNDNFHSHACSDFSLPEIDTVWEMLNLCIGGYSGLSIVIPPGYAQYYGGLDTTAGWLWGISQASSYHGSSSWESEPAYRLDVSSAWIISARALWDQHYSWGIVGYDTQCRPPQPSQR